MIIFMKGIERRDKHMKKLIKRNNRHITKNMMLYMNENCDCC